MKLATAFLQHGRERQQQIERGQLVARLLAGTWRKAPPAPTGTAAEWAEISELLIRSGVAGLAWRRVRDTALRSTAFAQRLQQAYRHEALQVALHERSLQQALALLRQAGVEPLLVKGWAIARLYPEPGLRPYCDIDLCVAPEQYAAAQAALQSPAAQGSNVDLHAGFGKFYDRQPAALFARSQLVRLGEVEVRVLAPEDHLRFLCLHLLRHGAVRPLWLCDIAVALENRPADFNWDWCLGAARQQADGIACVLGLAQQLFGVAVEGTPVEQRAAQLPSWLLPTVWQAWGTPYHSPLQVAAFLRQPVSLWHELPRHWPNTIMATMTVRAPFNEWPRWPFQLSHVAVRAASLLAQLVGTRG